MHPDQLDIRPDETAALHAAIAGLLDEAGITIDTPTPPAGTSPMACSGT